MCVSGLRKVYPYYFTFTTFTKGRWVGEKILEVFAREFRAHPAEEYERCIRAGTLTVNYQKVDVDYRLRHNDLLANVVHRYVNIWKQSASSRVVVLSRVVRLIFANVCHVSSSIRELVLAISRGKCQATIVRKASSTEV